MGSRSDWETMQHAADVLNELGIPHEVRVVSAHRTPDLLFDYARAGRGPRASRSSSPGPAGRPTCRACAPPRRCLPVLGVPVESAVLRGVDSLLSIVQMPAGVPVGTLAIGKAGAMNAGLLASRDPGDQGPRLREQAEANGARSRRRPCSNTPTRGRGKSPHKRTNAPERIAGALALNQRAGYGSRTRLTALGRLGTADIPIPRQRILTVRPSRQVSFRRPTPRGRVRNFPSIQVFNPLRLSAPCA